jgi:hypothetical protein
MISIAADISFFPLPSMHIGCQYNNHQTSHSLLTSLCRLESAAAKLRCESPVGSQWLTPGFVELAVVTLVSAPAAAPADVAAAQPG